MNRVSKSKISVFCLLLFCVSTNAQSVWTIEEVLLAVKENNYDLKAARQNIATAEVLTSKYNRGYLPNLNLNGGVGYSLNGIKQVYNFNFPDLDLQNIQSGNANLGISSSYLLFDGGQRKLRNEKNARNLDFANLQLDNINQLISFNASQVYYTIAQAMYNITILEESLEISRERFSRAKTRYQYGKQNKVDVLNAEVDISRDSLNLISIENDILNLKWQLNQLTLRRDTDYQIDTSFTLMYRLADVSELQSKMESSNKELIALQKNIELVKYDLALANKLNAPQISATGGYNLNYQKYDSNSQINLNRNNGLNLGLNASWNILDGGQRKVQEQLAIIDQENALIQLRTKENELFTQLNRLWNTYQNNLLSLEIEKRNIQTNRVNFELVKSLYENGQQSSVEFRQAQLNLLNAQSQYYIARTSAKLLEVEMDYLIGK